MTGRLRNIIHRSAGKRGLDARNRQGKGVQNILNDVGGRRMRKFLSFDHDEKQMLENEHYLMCLPDV